jgi:hypothetical protein
MHDMLITKTTQVSDEISKLESMGLSADDIRQAIADGLVKYKSATDLHPVTHAGSTAWGEINATLRAQLIGKNLGWDYSHQKGLSVTHNKKLGVAIIATSGDKDTGLSSGFPTTKNKKGPSTRDIVIGNMCQDLFEQDDYLSVVELRNVSVDSTETWILLYHIDNGRKEIRYELSLPSNISRFSNKEDKLKIDSWKHRIIFESLPFDNAINELPIENISFTDEVTFEVSKKI